jgi:hypothetical protein
MELRKQLIEEYHYATDGALPSTCGRDCEFPPGAALEQAIFDYAALPDQGREA